MSGVPKPFSGGPMSRAVSAMQAIDAALGRWCTARTRKVLVEAQGALSELSTENARLHAAITSDWKGS